MKSTRNKTVRQLALIAALAAPATPLPAGVTALDAQARAGATDADRQQRPGSDREFPTSQAASTRNLRDANLKCWQHGRLILQENDWRAGASALPGPQLSSPTGPYGRLQLSPFGDTFCILKSGRRDN